MKRTYAFTQKLTNGSLDFSPLILEMKNIELHARAFCQDLSFWLISVCVVNGNAAKVHFSCVSLILLYIYLQCAFAARTHRAIAGIDEGDRGML